MEVAENDTMVRKRLTDMNVVPKDRKISNVVLENNELRAILDSLKFENEKLKD
jgi:hypothetical protein